MRRTDEQPPRALRQVAQVDVVGRGRPHVAPRRKQGGVNRHRERAIGEAVPCADRMATSETLLHPI